MTSHMASEPPATRAARRGVFSDAKPSRKVWAMRRAARAPALRQDPEERSRRAARSPPRHTTANRATRTAPSGDGRGDPADPPGRERAHGRRVRPDERQSEERQLGEGVEHALEEDRGEQRGEGETALAGEHRRPEDFAGPRREHGVGREADGRGPKRGVERNAPDRAQDPDPAQRAEVEDQERESDARREPPGGDRCDLPADLRKGNPRQKEREQCRPRGRSTRSPGSAASGGFPSSSDRGHGRPGGALGPGARGRPGRFRATGMHGSF